MGKKKTNKQTNSYLSMITGSDGVSFLFPQLFLSQHRLQGHKHSCLGAGKYINNTQWGVGWC